MQSIAPKRPSLIETGVVESSTPSPVAIEAVSIRLPAYLIAVAAAMTVSFCAADEHPKSVVGAAPAQQKLNGTWIPQSFQIGEEAIPGELLPPLRLVISNDTWSLRLGDFHNQGTVQLDTTQFPNQLKVGCVDHYSMHSKNRDTHFFIKLDDDLLTFQRGFLRLLPDDQSRGTTDSLAASKDETKSKVVWRKASEKIPAAPGFDRRLSALEFDLYLNGLLSLGIDRYSAIGQLLALCPDEIPVRLRTTLLIAAADEFNFATKSNGLRLSVSDLVRPVGKKAVPTIVTMFYSTETKDEVFAAVKALKYLVDDARASLQDVLKSGSKQQRILAAEILASPAQHDATASLELLAGAMADDDVDVRFQASISTLALQSDNAAAVQVLTSDYEKNPDQILNYAVNSTDTASQLMPVLEKSLLDTNSRLRAARSAVRLVESQVMISPKIITALVNGLFLSPAESTDLAIQCAKALGQFPEFRKETLPPLESIAVSGEFVNLVCAASWSIVKIDPEQTRRYLPELLIYAKRGSRYSPDRPAVLHAISRLGRDAAGADVTLREIMLRNGETHTIAAALALLLVSPEAEEECFQQILNTIRNGGPLLNSTLRPFNDVGMAANPLVEHLLEFVESGEPRQKQMSIALLGAIGSGAKESLPALKRLVEKKTEKMDHSRLLDAIQKIENAAAKED